MAEQQRKGLSGLKEQAEQTVFADLRVTPALKAKLQERIRRGDGGRSPQRLVKPWMVGTATAAAAVAMLVWVGGIAGPVPMGEEAEYLRSGTSASAPMAGAPTTVPPMAPGSAAMNGVTVGKAESLTVQMQDAYGKPVPTEFTASSSAVKVTNQSGGSVVAGIEAQPGRKIIRNGEYSLQVTDAAKALADLQAQAATAGGYAVEATLNRGDDGSWHGRATLRIPTGQFSGAVQQLRGLGEVKHERVWSQDVTDQYMDLETRIRITSEHEQKLRELAGKAATFEDWLKLTQQLNEARVQLERMQGSLKLLGNQVEYATLSITLFQPAPGQVWKQEPTPKALWPEMEKAFGKSVQAIVNAGWRLAVGVAASTPFLVGLIVAGGGAAIAWRVRRRRTPPPSS